MRAKLTVYPPEAVYKRVETLCPRGGSISHTANIVITAAFNLADGVMTLEEFMSILKYGTSEKRAKKTKPPPRVPKGRPERTKKGTEEESPW